jgi:hypothetical protein
VEFDFGSPIWANAPIVPNGGSKFKGIAGGNPGQIPPFYNVSQTVLVSGEAYPFFFMTLPYSTNLSIEGFLMQCYQPYQSCVVQDESVDSSAVYSIRYKDVHLQGYGSSIPYLARGGFGFFWDGGGWSNQPTDFSATPAALLTVNCGLGTSSNQLPSILYTEKTYLFGEMLVDTCGVSNMQQGWQHNEFRELLAENGYGPMLRVNGAGVFQTDFLNPTYADYRGGAATPMFDLTNSQTAGARIIHPGCAVSSQPTLETSAGTSYAGLEINNTSGGCTLFGTNYAIIRDGNSSIDTYSNAQVAFTGTTGRAYYRMSVPTSAPQSAVVSTGGNVSVGTHTYAVTANDYDGGETTVSPSISATTTTGNQTVTVTMPATLPAGASGFNLYRDGSLVAANSCFYPQFPGAGGIFVDTYGYTCGVSAPTVNSAGQTVLSPNGFSAQKVRIAGETISSAPRGEQNIFLPGALNSTWTGSTWTPDKAVTVTRVQVQAKAGPAGCSTNAVVRLTDGSSPINVTIAAAASDSGAVTQNFAAGTSLTLSVQTAAAGCTTTPADVNVTIQYRMQ